MTRHPINHKLKLGITLFILGLIGIFSILTMEIPLQPEAVAILKDKFSQEQIKLLMLINPTIMLIVAVIVGVILYEKVKLTVPLIEKLLVIKNNLTNRAFACFIVGIFPLGRNFIRFSPMAIAFDSPEVG